MNFDVAAIDILMEGSTPWRDSGLCGPRLRSFLARKMLSPDNRMPARRFSTFLLFRVVNWFGASARPIRIQIPRTRERERVKKNKGPQKKKIFKKMKKGSEEKCRRGRKKDEHKQSKPQAK